MNCKIKICGITNLHDLDTIARCGADYGGVLVEIDSPRGVKLSQAWDLCSDPPLPMVVVTLDQPLNKLLDWAAGLCPVAMQLHGRESPDVVSELKSHLTCEIWKVIHLPPSGEENRIPVDAVLSVMDEYVEAGADRFLLDTAEIRLGKEHLGGTGKTVDWHSARAIRERSVRPLIIAGGIHPGNVVEAITFVRPDGIDLSSGVELAKGKKDPDKVLELITKARSCEMREEIC